MRWSNVPIPEAHVGALAAAAALHFVLPLRVPMDRGSSRLFGGAMLGAGIGLSAWAVHSAGDADLEGGPAVVTHGAYGLTRNPMYVGWSLATLGLALGTRSAWLVVTWLLAVAAIDREVDSEEARLLRRFGPEYAAYRDRVTRYMLTDPR